MFKRVPLDTKQEILDKIKNGMSVAEAARQYAVSTKKVYAWLQNHTKPQLSILEYNRLRKENE